MAYNALLEAPKKAEGGLIFKKIEMLDPYYRLNYVKCDYSVLACSFDGSREIKLLIFSNIAFSPLLGPKKY